MYHLEPEYDLDDGDYLQYKKGVGRDNLVVLSLILVLANFGMFRGDINTSIVVFIDIIFFLILSILLGGVLEKYKERKLLKSELKKTKWEWKKRYLRR